MNHEAGFDMIQKLAVNLKTLSPTYWLLKQKFLEYSTSEAGLTLTQMFPEARSEPENTKPDSLTNILDYSTSQAGFTLSQIVPECSTDQWEQ